MDKPFLRGMTRVTRKIASLRTGHETTFWDVASVIPYGKTLHLHSVGYDIYDVPRMTGVSIIEIVR